MRTNPKTGRAGALRRAKRELEEIIEELEELTELEKEEEHPHIPIQLVLDEIKGGGDDITDAINRLSDTLDSPLTDSEKVSKIRKILS